ncbi:hypothetical protein CC1G_13715 [Coprinopsis cinerea okayama7|uniref:SnoaL-like domain-containing protein n=1 Tax=Coprinopsis cinerea (strain Okayama-7 / 130 / ATCC MYA-4618 / FGSC 9003) TaxID=240176 RepID=D6RK53_COPC7|nr:hypothetical protein CC1G_13715 [Coprinopsis cinerea okayama7\|eukprot:XP_002912183.1 hypothetical protein CC1G_13715 [Coprinopsis cinerea okayama7\
MSSKMATYATTPPSNSTANTEDLNSAGLTPEVSRALKERDLKPYEQPVIKSIRELYSCKPTNETFEIYAKNAVFHDPIGIATGLDSIRNQFVGLAKIFHFASIPKFRVLENPPTVPPNIILIDQDVAYYRDANSNSPTKTVNSLLTIKLDAATNKIVSHSEDWNHKKSSTKEDGVFGWMNEQRKKITAGLVDTFVGNANKN